MAVNICIPSLGMGMREGKLLEWLVDNGAEVIAGQIIYTLESHKAVQEIEAPIGGKLRILAESDQAYPIGHVIADIS
jgi:pyruvate/2-oxoglutarate dehydrogenase complex dihydrolipoamide acyltransferase (E2) component